MPLGCDEIKQILEQNVYLNRSKGYFILNPPFDDIDKHMEHSKKWYAPCLSKEIILKLFGTPLAQDSNRLSYRIMPDDYQDKINYDGKEKYKNYITLNFIFKDNQFQNFVYMNVLYPTISVSH
jgi:hypothetical protein